MSTEAAYFEEMYRSSADPWHLAERWYEQRKYAQTVAALPERRYRSGFEPGCSVGQLTLLLAERCDALLSCDRTASAVATATAATADLPHVTVARMAVPSAWPQGTFDLIVLSELLYYFDRAERVTLLDRSVASLEPGGTLVTVHWNHPVAEHHGTGHVVAAELAERSGLTLLADHREKDFTLQVHLRDRPGGRAAETPAEREGLTPGTGR
ncbi:SAM-dependent methyltransferase [Streptomyces sp. SL13]|uniref:SAM-dependent methyltransferase n=1 Tax=Streptantibioticus silvisoli TaxID=2705255 RepID=A0AA90H270_9ACTN|nr:SAM-dependent methyltransferase [Streptantibioticus silvisoli]MDI5961291.1 SAM-dependent methyltransferase [Streptantibioticus silvisoli]MDI5968867.1 SAM-dependent methyltransferase [Streptantibioticus silvisoli]